MHKFSPTVCEDILLLGVPFLMKRLEFILKRIGEWWNVGNVFCCAQIWLASNILGEVAKEQVYRPQLCHTKGCKVCGVGPEHEGGDNLLLLAR